MSHDPLTVARFWSKVDVKGPDDCWNWTAGVGGHGYGVFYPGAGAQVLAHRFALAQYEDGFSGAHALHYCDNKRCVNPAHLHWGTHAQNMYEAMLSGLMRAGRPLPDSCPHGHEYTPENTLTSRRKSRHGGYYVVHACRKCNRNYLASRRAAKKENAHV